MIDLLEFLTESNRIEGLGPPTPAQIEVARLFIALPNLVVADLVALVAVLQPGAVLRGRVGLDVVVGRHLPPPGGFRVVLELTSLLEAVGGGLDPWSVHVAYEALHPFTDGNGRSGRLLWLWQMGDRAQRTFLHEFYYQTLARIDSLLGQQ